MHYLRITPGPIGAERFLSKIAGGICRSHCPFKHSHIILSYLVAILGVNLPLNTSVARAMLLERLHISNRNRRWFCFSPIINTVHHSGLRRLSALHLTAVGALRRLVEKHVPAPTTPSSPLHFVESRTVNLTLQNHGPLP